MRDLIYCVNEFEPKRLLIREVGSMGGKIEVNEELKGRVLGIKRLNTGLAISLDKVHVFLYEQDSNWGNKFAISYGRAPDSRTGIVPVLSTGINPDDSSLPEVLVSTIRGGNYRHLLELDFKGKIPLKFYSWFDKKAGWKNWCVDRSLA